MTWLSVRSGARSILMWHWASLPNDLQGFAHHANGKPGPEYNCSIMGWEGKGSPQLEEFTATACEIQRYGGLIRSMTRDLADAAKPVAPVLATSADNLSSASFTVPGYAGKVVVLVNTAVGAWCDGQSPKFLSPATVYRIDDEGNAVDYAPFAEARTVDACLASDKLECMDLETGRIVPMDADGFMKLSIRPGGGLFLFIGSKTDGEWARLRQEFRL
jgi:hypothetical protein